jgi:hypothetical protein
LRALLEWREAGQAAGATREATRIEPGSISKGEDSNSSTASGALAELAAKHGLNAKYLAALKNLLDDNRPNVLLDGIRARWRRATPDDIPSLVSEIRQWQGALWKFSSVGHIGKLGGPKAWMEPVNPLVARQEFRLKLAAPTNSNEVVIYLAAHDAGGGDTNDFVVWEKPRLVVPGRPDLLLRDARSFIEEMTSRRARLFSSTTRSLEAVQEAEDRSAAEPGDLAASYQVEPAVLQAWFAFLGIGSGEALKLDLFKNQMTKSGNYDFVQGWGSPDTPLLVANSSDQHVRIPGNMKAHGVAVHPSPKLNAAVGWRSPITSVVRVEATITHAHPECGNGIEWFVELRRGHTRQVLAKGFAQGSRPVQVGPIENLAVREGDLLSVLIGPRDANHSCDLTDLEFTITDAAPGGRQWSLTRDVSDSVLAGNPHADRFGNAGVWNFYSEPVSGGPGDSVIPAGSLLAHWQATPSPDEKARLATELERLLVNGPSAATGAADSALYRQLASLGGPLFAAISKPAGRTRATEEPKSSNPKARSGTLTRSTGTEGAAKEWGLDPALFGKQLNGAAVDPASLCVQAPSLIEIRLPADLVAGAEFVMTGRLEPKFGAEGSVQLVATTTKPSATDGLVASQAKVTDNPGVWTSSNREVSYGRPIVVNEGSAARRRLEADFDEFRRWFPAALCYEKIVPVDEVITLILYHREDEPLCRLMLDPEQKAKLDRWWDELHYISRDALSLVDVFDQLWQYATQDADPKVFEPLRKPIRDRATAFRQRLVDTQPAQLKALLDFAGRAYRHPLSDSENQELRDLYAKLRVEGMPHEDAFRLTLARVFISPSFLYRLEQAPPGAAPGQISDWELATRLSYFFWSSAPDAELSQSACAGRLHDPEVLAAQTRRMLHDGRVRRLASEFACTWLHIHDFDELNEKSERHFPTFTSMRGPMYEEAIHFFTDLFENDRSVLDVFDADYTFLNGTLAQYYGISGITGSDWRRVEGMRKLDRGGVLGLGATLAKESGASRTSPILRGDWVAEVLLGEKIPRPPKDVPRLPEDEATETLTVRQLVEKHSSDPRCAGCHRRFDGYGFALEGYDAVGRLRTKDLGERPINTRARLFDGTEVEGAAGLRKYLVEKRRDALLDQFCRKLLGYALGRSVLLSDKPLLADMRRQLASHDYQFSAAVESIVRSPQFLEIRGKDMADEE